MRRHRLLLLSLLAPACGGSLRYYGKEGPDDGTPLETLNETGDTDTHVQTNPTETETTETTDPTGTTTEPGCDRLADCDDPRCANECDGDRDGEVTDRLGGRDCNDTNPDVYPGAEDVCDRRDNDCDGVTDGDGDRDGFDVCDDCDDTDRQVHPNHADPCDGVDSDCDGDDCAPWEEDFEQAGLGANWVKTGQADWHISSDWRHRGAQSVMTGNITHSENTTLTLTASFPSGGAVSFWTRGDTEACCDILRFKIDGADAEQWSGNWTWSEATYSVGPGNHTFKWEYAKDFSVDGGQDQAAIDDLTLEGGRP